MPAMLTKSGGKRGGSLKTRQATPIAKAVRIVLVHNWSPYGLTVDLDFLPDLYW